MPLIKIHQKKNSEVFTKNDEKKLFLISKDFFSLPNNLVVIFSLEDLSQMNDKDLIIEIELKKRKKKEINKYTKLLLKEIPKIDAISIKMFGKKDTFFIERN